MFVFIPGVQRARASLRIPKPGDNLAVTLSKVYGLSMAHREMAWLVQLHLTLNKDLATAYQPMNSAGVAGGVVANAAQDIKASISPLERFVFKGGVEEALFSPATKGVQGEWINMAAASKLSKIARAGAVGQVLLLGLGVMAMATPFGWTAALVLGTAMSMGAGKAGELLAGSGLSRYGDVLSLEKGHLVNRWCQ